MVSQGLVPTSKGAMVALDDADILKWAETEATEEENAYEFVPPSMSFRFGRYEVEGTDYAKKEIEGTVIYARETRGLWLEENKDPRPQCSSADGITGIDIEGVEEKCAKCTFNQWGSSGKIGSRGKACGEFRLLLVMPEDMPTFVSLRLPVTSVGNWDQYCSGLRVSKRGRAYFTVETKFTLEKKERSATESYHIAKFTMGRDLTPAELRIVKKAREEGEEVLAQLARDIVSDKETSGEGENEEAPF